MKNNPSTSRQWAKDHKNILLVTDEYEFGHWAEEHPEGALPGTPYVRVDEKEYELTKGIDSLSIWLDEKRICVIHGWSFYDPLIEPDPFYCRLWLLAIRLGKSHYQRRELEKQMIEN